MLKKRYLFLILIVCFFAISTVNAEEIGNDTNMLVNNHDSNLLAESVDGDILDVSVTDNVNQTIYAGDNDLVCGDDTLGASLSDNEISANDYNAVLSVENQSYIVESVNSTSEINKIDTTLTIPYVVVASGSPAEVVAILKDCYGNPVSGVKVKIVVGDSDITIVTDVHGRAAWLILDLAPGEYKVSARSSGVDSRYAESKGYGKVIVYTERIDTTLTVPDVIVIGNSSGVVVATLRDCYGNPVSGVKVKIVVGDLSIINKTDAKGQVSLDISGLAPGEYRISARSSGVSEIYEEAKATAKAFVSAEKLDTTLTVPDVIVIGKGVVVATLKDCYGNPVSGVPVKIVVGNLTKTVNTDAKGQVSLDISGLAPGEYMISARSSGVSDIYKEAKVTSKILISKDKLNTTLTVFNVVVASGSPAEVVAILEDCYGNRISGVKVKIVVGDSDITIVTDVHGRAAWLILDLAPGEYKVSARSSGVDSRYAESKGYGKVIVYES